MFPSFYYTVMWKEAVDLQRKIKDIGVPYKIDAHDGKVAFLFPDLPVRTYGQIRGIFGTDGKRFI